MRKKIINVTKEAWGILKNLCLRSSQKHQKGANQKPQVDAKSPKVGEGTQQIGKPLCKT